MSTDKLRRVCMRLREKFPDNHFKKSEIFMAISEEIGTSHRTLHDNYDALRRHEYIKGRYHHHDHYVTDKV